MDTAILDALTSSVISVAGWMAAKGIDLPSDLAANIEAVKTVEYYQRSLWANVRKFYNSEIDAGEFIDEQIRLIEGQMRKAWYEGMRNVGYENPPKEMTAEFDAELQAVIDSEFDHVLDFAQAIEDAKLANQPLEPFRARTEMWVNRYTDVVNQAEVFTKPEQRFRWEYGDTQHCETCAALNGTVATGQQWTDSPYQPQSPPNDALECGGWRCQCRLVPTDEPLTEGGIPSV